MKEEAFKKNEYIQIENQQRDTHDKLYMVVSGRVSISKSIEFFDENGSLKRKDQLIMEIEGGDVIGEDFIWFDRPCSYSARALSNTVRVLSIRNSSFDKYFGKCIPASKKMFEQRNQFM